MADIKSLANKNIGKTGVKFPEKRTINLLYKEKNTQNRGFNLIMLLIFITGIVAMVRFFVYEPLSELSMMEAEYAKVQDQLLEVKKQNADYNDVSAEYARYGNSCLTQEEINRRNRVDMMKVIDEKVKVTSGIQSIVISGNTATLLIEKTSLSEVSSVVKALEESKIVEYVAPCTAQTDDKDSGIIEAQILITFKSPADQAQEELAEAAQEEGASDEEAAQEEGASGEEAAQDENTSDAEALQDGMTSDSEVSEDGAAADAQPSEGN